MTTKEIIEAIKVLTELITHYTPDGKVSSKAEEALLQMLDLLVGGENDN